MFAQGLVFAVLFGTLILFVVGRWRYDVVALLALLVLTIFGVVPGSEAFSGFGHPAVVTVAAVLVVGRGLLNSGVVDVLAGWLAKAGEGRTTQVGAMSALITACSGFMNNVGALAIFMPVALQMARKAERSPSFLLMPIAFASLLGGMMTLIGTPPNIIISTFRAETGAAPFRMFDFLPVGLGVAVAIGASCAFLTPIGHQSNTLVMGPGGYRFGDYWRMGLPLEGVVLVVAIPILLWWWPM